MNETMKDIVLFFGCILLMALCGCVTEDKAVDVGGKGVWVDSKTGRMSVGSVSVSTVPADAESAVLKVDEDTAWITDTFTRDIYLRLTGTNAVASVEKIVESICRTFTTVAATNGNVKIASEVEK